MEPSTTLNKQNKTLTQQVFHPGLFNKPKQQSVNEICNENTNDNDRISPDVSLESQGNQNTESSKWTVAQKRKRQKNSPEANKNQKQSKINTYWLSQPVPTSNSFSDLENDEDKEEPQPQQVEKIAKPPPIFIDKVMNIRPLTKLLAETVPDLFEIKVLPKDQIKIQPKTSDAYRTIVKELDARGTEYFTYKPKQERSFKVILKKMHPTTDIEEIREALAQLGHVANNIWNMKQASTKIPLHMFVVELHQNPNNKEVYNIKNLLHCRVKFEPPRPKRTIPQCANCLAYGHTKSYCRRNPRCIKCAGDHTSSACVRKERSDDVRCALCDGNHPANYKGCMVYKELQKQKYPPLRNKPTKPKQPFPQGAPQTDRQMVKKPHVDVALPVANQPKINQPPTIPQKDKEEKQTTLPQELSPTQFQEQHNVKSTTNEVKELMDMFKQMMQQMTTMTNLLLSLITELRSQPVQQSGRQDFMQAGGRRPTLLPRE